MLEKACVNKDKLFIIMVCVFFFISGCASTLTPLSLYRVGKEPAVGIIYHASVGEVIYTEFDFVEHEGVTLINGYMKPMGLQGKFDIPAGTLLLGYSDEKGLKQFCTTYLAWSNILEPADIVCFSDSNNDNNFDKLKVTQMYFGAWQNIEELPFKSTMSSAVRGQRMELIYEGVSSDGTLKIVYREYSDNLARPAFFQEVNFALNQNSVTNITFKGAEIEVLEANNNVISYRVKSNFRNK